MTRLDRRIAIKILTFSFARKNTVQRLERESRALPLAHHPIHTIHEVGGDEDVIFARIRDRQNRREKIVERKVSLKDAVSIAFKSDADRGQGPACSAASSPRMEVRPDGLVKVRDFGLAKALRGRSPEFIYHLDWSLRKTLVQWERR